MSNFIFNWANAALANATLNLSTGDYYAHLVTTVPALGHSTVANLVLPAVSGYTSTPLTGLNYNTTRWTFNSFDFPKYAFVSAPTGVVICKRNGASPANTDGIICYSDFNNSIGQTINLAIGAYVVNLQFTANGAINFSYRNRYQSGAFNSANTPIDNGIFYLLGTNNNTTAWNNPSQSKVSFSDTTIGPNSIYTNLNTSPQGYQNLLTIYVNFNFDRAVQVGVLGLRSYDTSNNLITFQGSADNINWTTLATNSGLVPGWNLLNCTNQTYWKYFKIFSPGAFSVMNVELFESSILSTSVNLV